jgi:hypothetical protein
MPNALQARNSIPSTTRAQISRELLGPIATFLFKSGLSRAQLLSEFRLALSRASSSKLKVVHMALGEEAANIVNRWLRDPNYLNNAGRPAELPLRGNRSITTLVKESQSHVSPSAALNLLVEFGIVRKVKSARYRLMRRLVDFGHTEYLPFEPNFKFLVDATRVSTSRLRDARKAPGLFWQCADNSRIDARLAKRFLQFAQQRSLSFMHEINDWLDEHELKRSRSAKRTVQLKRLGIGLFGISQ